jgi:Leucine-rich repeat (LRR) protein
MIKKIKYILGILIAWTLLTSAAISADKYTEEASRYLKLSATYIMNCDFNEASNFIKKAENRLERSNSTSWDTRYWKAVAKEYRGYLALCLDMKDAAKDNFMEAKRIYTQLVSMKGGSQDAIDNVLNSLDNIEKNISSNSFVIPGISNRTILNLDNQKIKDNFSFIPDGIQNLSLANNRIKNVYGLVDKTNLTHLNLANNRIKELPMNIDDLSNLEWLDLSGNRLKDLPPSMCNMTNLKVLNLKNNRLPIEDITNLIKCLPNTNILYDEYIRKDDSEDEDDFELEF